MEGKFGFAEYTYKIDDEAKLKELVRLNRKVAPSLQTFCDLVQ